MNGIVKPTSVDDERWMAAALAEAERGLERGELPIGAVVVAEGEVLGAAHTQEREQQRLLVHAELLALDRADRALGLRRRDGLVLYTTLEPCLLCLGAAATTMVSRVVFALPSPSDGTAEVATWWEAHRAPGLEAVRLPTLEAGAGAGADASRSLFVRYATERPDPGDGLARWAEVVSRGRG